MIESKVVNRTAAFVFLIGDKFYGTIRAFVPGGSPESEVLLLLPFVRDNLSREMNHEADGHCDSKKTGNQTDRLAVKMGQSLGQAKYANRECGEPGGKPDVVPHRSQSIERNGQADEANGR
ncbi:MAG: hypothetical protein WBW33_24890 [Bryobacteraceae bacterium]